MTSDDATMFLLSRRNTMTTDSTQTYTKKHSEISDDIIRKEEASKKIRRYLPAG